MKTKIYVVPIKAGKEATIAFIKGLCCYFLDKNVTLNEVKDFEFILPSVQDDRASRLA